MFADVDNKMTIAQEEIFGPVLAVIPYDTPDDAVRIANDSDYGLAGSVWTSDVASGLDIAKRVRTGTYGVNGSSMNFAAPFGGYKQSGVGRELGPEGLEEYLELKAINMPAGWTPAQLTNQLASIHLGIRGELTQVRNSGIRSGPHGPPVHRARGSVSG